MKTEKRTQQKVYVNASFTEYSKENAKTAMEIYRMLYFLNKIQDPRFENNFKKYKAVSDDMKSTELKGNDLIVLSDYIGQKNLN